MRVLFVLGCGTPGEYPNCSTEDFAQHFMCQGFKKWSKLAALSVEQFLYRFLEARPRPSLLKGRAYPGCFRSFFCICRSAWFAPKFQGSRGKAAGTPCPATSAGLPECRISSLPLVAFSLFIISGASFLILFSEAFRAYAHRQA